MELLAQISSTRDTALTLLTIFLMLSPFLVFGGIALALFLWIFNSNKKRRAAWANLASQNGFSFFPERPSEFLQTGSYSMGVVDNVTEGRLPNTENTFSVFDQRESRGSGKSRRTYYRTVIRVETPDLRSQFVINSKLNNMDNTGGNLDAFKSQQHLVVEGNFSDYFDIYAPETEKRDALVLLSPDVLEYLLNNFVSYDIELIDNELFIYAYGVVDPTLAYSLLPLADELVRKMRLRVGDARVASQEIQSVGMVARTGADNIEKKYLKKKSAFWSLLIVAFVILIFILPQDKKAIAYALFIVFTIFSAIRGALRQSRLRKRYHNEVKRNSGEVK